MRKKKKAHKQSKTHAELWFRTDTGSPRIFYPDGYMEYFATNDPRPQWCRIEGTVANEIPYLRKLSEFVCLIK
jgi:hypothetical protein